MALNGESTRDSRGTLLPVATGMGRATKYSHIHTTLSVNKGHDTYIRLGERLMCQETVSGSWCGGEGGEMDHRWT